jgi:ribonuclease J
MTLRLTIHRSASQIGGNCIELEHSSGERLILDAGRPLDAPGDATGLLPATLNLQRPAHVLISHPHQDHYGLLNEIPHEWPVYCGAATQKLMAITAGITGGKIDQNVHHWEAGQPTAIGPFTVTALLTDHSAFDAHMLLIEAGGKRVLYSGDFRIHGRKSSLVERLMASPPQNVDVLLLEGTNLGSDKPTKSEADLEDDFVNLFHETPGRVFVAWSAQNVDRTVTLYRAAKKTGRTLVVDLYTAEVMELLAEHGRLPRAGFDNLKVVITANMSRMYRRKGRSEFVDQMATGGRGISAAALNDNRDKWIVMFRDSLHRDFDRKGVKPDTDDCWSWSMWSGYLKDVSADMKAWLSAASPRHIHTSGHASPRHLRDFAEAISPSKLVPIHSFTWDDHTGAFPSVHRLQDGETLMI